MHQETLLSTVCDCILALMGKISIRCPNAAYSTSSTDCYLLIRLFDLLLGQDCFLHLSLLIHCSLILYHYFSLIVRLQNFTLQLRCAEKIHHHFI